MTDSFWAQVNESALQQGDYLTDCAVPIFIDPTVGP